jgi:5-formyltetrahydrofolate cyclo-ligase
MADGLTDGKRALRRAMRRMRGAMAWEALAMAGRAVVPHVLDLDGLHDGPVLLYVSIRRELPTDSLFEALWAAGVTTAVPAMVGGHMEARLRLPHATVVDDDAGIPTALGPVVEPTLVLCPGLAFDRRGGRLGYGGGNYDRWIAARPQRPRLFGRCVDGALVDAVPTGDRDVPMEGIITPSGVVPTV